MGIATFFRKNLLITETLSVTRGVMRAVAPIIMSEVYASRGEYMET